MKCKLVFGLVVALPVVLFTLLGCEANSEEDLYDIVPPDTTNITWDPTISEILWVNCVPCHNPVLHYNDVKHHTYQDELVVVNDGRLNGVVNHLPGYLQMPYQLPKLPEEELLLINKWLENGAPEN